MQSMAAGLTQAETAAIEIVIAVIAVTRIRAIDTVAVQIVEVKVIGIEVPVAREPKAGAVATVIVLEVLRLLVVAVIV